MIVLFIKARLENVAKLSLPEGHTYNLTVSMPDCLASATSPIFIVCWYTMP